MIKNITKGWLPVLMAMVILSLQACKKEAAGDAKIKPPVRTYVVTARIDKKGTNSDSEGTAVLKGLYDEESKQLSYSLEYEDITPNVITLRSGAKGSEGTFIKELFNRDKNNSAETPITGEFSLSPLQERNLLKGRWFVAVSTVALDPEISGVLTLKQSSGS